MPGDGDPPLRPARGGVAPAETPCVCAIPLAAHQGRAPGLAAALLDPAERDRAGGFRSETDRARFVLGRAAVRILCGVYQGIAPARVRLRTAARGKPELEGPPGFHFNVAHSGGWVMVAWDTTGPVGVDVERIRETRSVGYPELAQRVFTADECAWVGAETEPVAQARRFTRVWVRKEAVVKAAGRGIAETMAGFAVLRRTARGAEWIDPVPLPGDARVWRVHAIDLDDPHPAAVAALTGATPVRVDPAVLGW